jgi:hypothetical protein
LANQAEFVFGESLKCLANIVSLVQNLHRSHSIVNLADSNRRLVFVTKCIEIDMHSPKG